MAQGNRIDNQILVKAGIELMSQNGNHLTKRSSNGRAMLYSMQNEETVRLRTCNDHILIAVAAKPIDDARLNIEGTDWLLIVMPEVQRTHGNIIAYLVPTEEAVGEVRKTHKAWLDTNPNTKGDNTTWNLWFDRDGPKGSGIADNYADKWAKYRLEGEVSTVDIISEPVTTAAGSGTIRAAVEAARENIAIVAGVSAEAVKISIDFSA